MKPLSTVWFITLLFALGAKVALACSPVDFLARSVPAGADGAERQALLLAYPGIVFSDDGTTLSVNGNPALPFGQARSATPRRLLSDPTVREQFTYVYPLEFDLSSRTRPWFDPGRIRNDAFFRALYAQTEADARRSLVTVRHSLLEGAAIRITAQQQVACQFEAALSRLQASGTDHSRIFRSPGGGFNWRAISGTSRLSAHSFGIAVDINPEIGQYWQWTGARAGQVGAYDNRVPEEIVRTMERFGFIWGGKWHHFDGMHFEYRPELILYSRIVSRDVASSP